MRASKYRSVAAFSALLLAAASAAAQGLPEPIDLIQVDVKAKPSDAAWTARPTQILPRLDGYVPRGPRSLSRYGGLLGAGPAPAAGFFRVFKAGGAGAGATARSWLADPEGHLFLAKGIVSVSPGGSARTQAAFAAAFGTQAAWAESTASRLRAWGFNATGAWSSGSSLAKAGLTYAPVWNFMQAYGAKRGGIVQQPGHAGYPNDAIFVFDPGFEAFIDDHAKQLAAVKEDPWLVGHFSDNELPWPVDALKKYLSLPAAEPGRTAAQAWLDAQKKNLGRPATAGDVTAADEEAFRFHQADRYFSLVAAAIRKHDPNHLFLGPRLHGRALGDSMVVKAAGRHCDVVAFNWYHSWTPDPARMDAWARWAGKPFLVTEWYAKGHDVPGLANTSGAGWLVKTQKDRGHFYQNFTLSLLKHKSCVGWHWFKYQDNDPEDLSTDPSNRDSNKGVLDIFYQPYTDLTTAMRDLNTEAYSLIEFFDGRAYTGIKPTAKPARINKPRWINPRTGAPINSLGRTQP